MVERIREEIGYSLVEVMVSMLIMTIAILPMVSMFDMGIHGATTGSNYDKARMLANLKLEQAKNLPFDSGDDTIQDVKDNFPEDAGTLTTYDGSGYYQSQTDPPKTEPGFPNFTYVIEKQYMAQPPTDTGDDPADPSENWGTCATNGTCEEGTNLIRVTVTVQWDDTEYKTYGLVTG